MSDWKIDIAGPNNLAGQLVVDSSIDDDAIVEQFRAFIASVRNAEAEPITGERGIPASIQPRRDATVGKA